MNAYQPIVKPEGKRLRRKLQKIGSPHRNSQGTPETTQRNQANAGRAGTPCPYSRTSRSNNVDADGTSLQPQLLPPDLSDPKWLDFVRKSAYIGNESDTLRLRAKESPPRRMEVIPEVIPELAHLSIHNEDQSRKSSDNSFTETVYYSSSSTPVSTISMRRYAKTPVFRIGQLEDVSSQRPLKPHKVPSVELIAESYRALLDSRCSVFSDKYMTPKSYEEQTRPDSRRQRRGDDVTPDAALEDPATPKSNMGSPTSSDDGTLIGFEEDAIYFKPSPSSSPLRQDSRRSSRRPLSVATLDNPGLGICVDLLTRELSSAVSGNPLRPSDETSALQIWVMIEAYERLHDKIKDMGLDAPQANSMEAMFDTWLRGLYAVHDKMTGNDKQGSDSESDYGDAQSFKNEVLIP
ncbi:uncharacterized protein BCR38DRAFT_411122 [Pseudomassariella vexata]|uniref:Mating-type switching protein swi10 n=1 Tax=Pseudomassariella vexata TaxID=1141098 RepID=A0A1Y2DPM2_9PEZI|nr:uncharacterized protein BCR38DRAFT_411122 [Pseudomassariella vexata]ORY61233.1 hypothetical protein BCR38DRAFT_411122 [Pseudomassariella vexata]